MVKRFPKSHKLIDSALDGVHAFSDGLGTLDNSLELVLDLFDMLTRWKSICVGNGESCFSGCGGLLNRRD